MNLQDLVANNQFDEAIELIKTHVKGNDGFLLKARYNSLMKNYRIGVLSQSDFNVERSRIASSILSYSRKMPKDIVGTTTVLVVNDFNELELKAIIKENKRRRPEAAQQARNILTKYREYQDKKSETPTFDPNGRRLKRIINEANELIAQIKEQKEDSLEAIVKRIEDLLSEPVPSYFNLSKAYKLVVGRGFKSNYVSQNLEIKPKDDEVKITIAEMIEAFASELSLR